MASPELAAEFVPLGAGLVETDDLDVFPLVVVLQHDGVQRGTVEES